MVKQVAEQEILVDRTQSRKVMEQRLSAFNIRERERENFSSWSFHPFSICMTLLFIDQKGPYPKLGYHRLTMIVDHPYYLFGDVCIELWPYSSSGLSQSLPLDWLMIPIVIISEAQVLPFGGRQSTVSTSLTRPRR